MRSGSLVGLTCGAAVFTNVGAWTPPEAAVATPETAFATPAHEPRDAASRIATSASNNAPSPSVMSVADAWAWLRATFPRETDSLRLATDRPLEELLAWAPQTGSVTVYGRRCAPLRLVRREASLVGRIHESTKTRGRTKTTSFEEISFSRTITRYCSSFVEYERLADGRWEPSGEGGFGCADTMGYELSEASESEVRYGAGRVDVAVTRGEGVPVVQRCLDGRSRTCLRPGSLQVVMSPRSGNFGFARAPVMASPPQDGVDCTTPCGSVEREPHLRAINDALARARFEWTGLDEHPVLFRTRAACLAYRKRHEVSASDRDLW